MELDGIASRPVIPLQPPGQVDFFPARIAEQHSGERAVYRAEGYRLERGTAPIPDPATDMMFADDIGMGNLNGREGKKGCGISRPIGTGLFNHIDESGLRPANRYGPIQGQGKRGPGGTCLLDQQFC